MPTPAPATGAKQLPTISTAPVTPAPGAKAAPTLAPTPTAAAPGKAPPTA